MLAKCWQGSTRQRLALACSTCLMPKQDEAVLSCFTLPWGSTALFLSVNSAACCITDPEKVDGILVRAAPCLGAVSFLACQSMSVAALQV